VQLRFTRAELEAALRPAAKAKLARTIVLALFSTRQQAEAALTALAAGGFPVEVLSAVTPQGQAVRFPSGREHPGAGERRHVAMGAVVGANPDVVLFGYLLIWASEATGGLVGLLTSLGSSPEQAKRLTEQVRTGQFLVAVQASDEETKAWALLDLAGGSEVQRLRA
jgi:hypothetical protein